RVYADTTNPDVATGDGVAMAWRAGAVISDIEFVQFHPTALHLEGAPRFLLSEALRGEGARLLNVHGERFMPRYHPMAELAPRDVVSRAIVAEMRRTGAPHVLLDISGRGDFVRRRFPRIHSTCLAYGIDLDRQPAPVCPAAHYAMGGVWTDLSGRTSLEGLWAAGEAACTGVHGANRLASNSLLEGVVYGARAGVHMRESAPARTPARFEPPQLLEIPELALDAMRRLATGRLGIVRCADSLSSALWELEQAPCRRALPEDRDSLERANTRIVLTLIARCAMARQESRGAHYRTDYPESSPRFRAHSRITRSRAEVEFAPVEGA
ncbi:MAG: L-aspartate oxidase, partial [Bryobacteraceae bacterium]